MSSRRVDVLRRRLITCGRKGISAEAQLSPCPALGVKVNTFATVALCVALFGRDLQFKFFTRRRACGVFYTKQITLRDYESN